MASTTSVPAAHAGLRTLFSALIDDAAAFPPLDLPVADAVAKHRELVEGAWASVSGPLLVPAILTADLAAAVTAQDDLAVSVVARPDADLELLRRAAEDAVGTPGLRVERIETAWNPTWSTIDSRGLTLVLDVPRTTQAALSDIAIGRRALGRDIIAKFRTGTTPIWHWPNEAELAAFITEAVLSGVPFLLAGGLHRAVRHTSQDEAGHTIERHGLLNVILAVDTAIREGSAGALEAVLADRDSGELAARVAALDEQRAWAVRALLRSVGCSAPLDLIGDLTELGLLASPAA